MVLMAHMGRYLVIQRLQVIALTLLKVTAKQNGNSKRVFRVPILQEGNHSARLAIGKTLGSEAPDCLPS